MQESNYQWRTHEFDLQSDWLNCGACDHNGIFGSCSNGTCVPIKCADNQGKTCSIPRMGRRVNGTIGCDGSCDAQCCSRRNCI